MIRSLRLTTKLTLAFLVFAVGLVVVIGLLSYTSGRSALEAAPFSELSTTLIEKQASFERWIAESQTEVAGIAASPLMKAMMSELRSAETPQVRQAVHDTIVAELRSRRDVSLLFVDLSLLEPDTGRVLVSTDSSQEGTFKEDRLFFINGAEAPYVQNVYFALECQCVAMTASAPLDDVGGQLVGVVAARLNLDEMSAIINRNTGVHDTSDAYLVNTARFLVTQPRLLDDPAVLRRGIHTLPVAACLEGSSGTKQSEDYRGVQVMAAYRWLPDRDLCLVVKIDQAEALAPVLAYGEQLFWFSLIALGIASLVALVLALTITRPILALKEGVTRFGRGELDVRLAQTTHDEIGAVVHEFNTMANAIAENETRLQRYAEELEQRVVERTSQLLFLADASRSLSESFDYATRLKQVAQLAVPQIADWCSVDILNDEGKLERLAVVHANPDKIELVYELQRQLAKQAEPDATRRVLESGKSSFNAEITREKIDASVSDPETRRILHELGFRSSIIAPLMAHDRAVGTLTLVMAESGRHYELSDLELAEDLARRAALFIDNARLYHETQELNSDLEQRVEERTAELVTANRELESFSYSVSHDLRTPLRALDGFSQALEEDYATVLDEDGKEYLNRIRLASQRMGQLIDDLLELSRLSRSDMHIMQVDMSEIVRQIVGELRDQEPDREVAVIIQPNLNVTGDARLLRIALVNLLSNAWKYTGNQAQPKIEFGSMMQTEQRVYYVRDNGAGFDMTYVDKLFGVFQRLHTASEFPGNGIGLAIVQRVVQRHRGQVWAEGAIGAGATFYFTLNLAKDISE